MPVDVVADRTPEPGIVDITVVLDQDGASGEGGSSSTSAGCESTSSNSPGLVSLSGPSSMEKS